MKRGLYIALLLAVSVLTTTAQPEVTWLERSHDFGVILEQDGKAKGVVMLGAGHSHNSNVKYLIARMYAKKLGLPYINFYTQMTNERGYVVGRIRKMLN